MERRVKERLVGATVLVAAAVILIPEMLSGPKRTGDATAKRGSDEPFKTYTIDLNRSPGAPTATQTAPQTAPVEEAAPPPETPPETESSQVATEQAASAPDSESPAEERAQSAQASPESASPQPAPPAQTAAAERSPEPAPRPREEQAPAAQPATPPQPVASRPVVPTSKGWAVQLGSFASRPTADRMAKELSGSGQAAFVMPVKSGANTLYRVRVGPFADRAAANDALVGIKKRVANAAVVAHP